MRGNVKVYLRGLFRAERKPVMHRFQEVKSAKQIQPQEQDFGPLSGAFPGERDA
jgi:hypothetical protein